MKVYLIVVINGTSILELDSEKRTGFAEIRYYNESPNLIAA